MFSVQYDLKSTFFHQQCDPVDVTNGIFPFIFPGFRYEFCSITSLKCCSAKIGVIVGNFFLLVFKFH
jgi:hypothetical protein